MNLHSVGLPAVAVTALIALALPAAASDSLRFSPIAITQSAPPPQGRGPQGGPPPREAIDACASQTAGAARAFQTENGATVNGACRQPPRGRNNGAVCVPNRAKS